MGLLIKEEWIDFTNNCWIGDSGIYESFTDNLGKLFESCQKEYGRCVSVCYVDNEKGKTRRIGWVFERKIQYTDIDEYLIHCWITVHEPEKYKEI